MRSQRVMRSIAVLLWLAACAAPASRSAAPAPASRSADLTPVPAAKVAATANAGAAATPAQAVAGLAARVDRVFAEVASPAGPGCAVGIYRAGELVLARGYGMANLDHTVAITPATVFEIASLSKQFTATAILLLAADGKLALDADVRTYLPELPAAPRVITLRHLLHHTGGLREYDTLLDLSGYGTDDVATEPEALQLVARQRGVNFAAGTEWAYSNTGYFLLGQVVRRVSGQSLAAFSHDQIFGPLGMTHTVILDDHTRIVAGRATGDAPRDAGGFQIAMSGREETGEGNVQSSIEDLARWDANFYAKTVGGDAWLVAIRAPGQLDGGATAPYGMGLQLGTLGGLAYEAHVGGWAGYRAHIVRIPSERVAVAVLCNLATADASGLANRVMALVVPRFVAEATPAPAMPVALDEMIGVYLDPASLAIRTIARAGDQLVLGAGIGDDAPPPRKLAAVGPRTLRVVGTMADYTFEPAVAGKPARISRSAELGPARRYERVTPPATAALAALAGRYRSDELTHDLELVVVDGAIRMRPLGKPLWDGHFVPVTPDVFVGSGFTIRAECDPRGCVVALVMAANGYRAFHRRRVAER